MSGEQLLPIIAVHVAGAVAAPTVGALVGITLKPVTRRRGIPIVALSALAVIPVWFYGLVGFRPALSLLLSAVLGFSTAVSGASFARADTRLQRRRAILALGVVLAVLGLLALGGGDLIREALPWTTPIPEPPR